MKRLFVLIYTLFIFCFTPPLYSQINNNIPEDEYVADDDGYDEMDDEYYDSEDEDTPLEEMDPIYQDDDEPCEDD
jgi:hypothetical protein